MSDNRADKYKSVIISSPAGSGKTEKLARRYISLLRSGVGIERILAITFTEKAAAEMKDRILSILGREDTAILGAVRRKVPLMRISTIHSFCLSLLKRFSLELGLDPSLEVADELSARALWSEAVSEILSIEAKKPGIFTEMLSGSGIRGVDELSGLLDALYKKRPMPDILIQHIDKIESARERDILKLYAECRRIYSLKKRAMGLLDFNDLELISFEALSQRPEWHNILYAFDERTDHLLVDEFQDTSTLQWGIIDRLTEEWRAGMGAKRERGISPTIFLVGDEKQSIYLFRGANVSVFQEAKARFSEWLGSDYEYVEAKENYRSLPEIVSFVNALFGKIMPAHSIENWKTRYSPFEATRKGEGKVCLMLLNPSGSTREARRNEASLMAKAIRGYEGRYEIYDRKLGENAKRPARYEDMVMLLGRRTHLGIFEEALRDEGVPFIVLKGMGFYDEPETAMLRDFVLFLADPYDDYSLLNLLRCPALGLDYPAILKLNPSAGNLIEAVFKSGRKSSPIARASELLGAWLERKDSLPLSVQTELMLSESGAWSALSEPKRRMNAKKFIGLLESYESQGMTPLMIRELLISHRDNNEIGKANVNAEGMNAVRIMTIHAAKGLEFPMVFLPSLDERAGAASGGIAIDDEPDGIRFSYEPDESARRKNPVFIRMREKEAEEAKRLFYVAATRAADFLMMSASRPNGKPAGRLALLEEAFGVLSDGPKQGLPFKTMLPEDVEALAGTEAVTRQDARAPFLREPSYRGAFEYETGPRWIPVTDDMTAGGRHGEDWTSIGQAMHKILYEISEGITSPDGIRTRARTVLSSMVLSETGLEDAVGIIEADISKITDAGYLREIVLPRKNSYSELPVHLQMGAKVFRGRVDRIIIEDNEAFIYDYKTYPVRPEEMPELIDKYRFQMDIYREAVERIFKVRASAYLLFTHTPELFEMWRR